MSAEKTEEDLLRDLVLIDKAIREKEAVGHPGTYGMPDLLYPKGFKPGLPTYDVKGLHTSAPGEDFPDGWTREPLEQEETDLEYKTRQDNDLMSFLEANIYVTKDGKRRYFRVIDKIKPFICDVFFLRSKKVIVWKPRGGGGSLGASVLIWLLMIYHKRSILDISGSGEQSKVVYKYVCQFWECIPGLSEGMLSSEPLKEETRLSTGVQLFCKPATEKQVRGKHMSVLAIDEVCQEDARVEVAFRAALQTVLSEEDSVVLLFSTFHLPSGIFQEYWDNAEEKGFVRVKWNVFDTMLPCKRGLEEATPDDPKALCYCEKCDLTVPEFTTDDRGRKVQIGWEWCHGQARTSQGWESYDKIVAAMRMNIGTNVFSTEFACFLGDTPVMTDRGWVPIEEIKNGDIVLTHNGNWRPATVMSRNYDGDIYKIRSRGSLEVSATAEHPFYVAKKKYGNDPRINGWEWLQAKDVTTSYHTRFPVASIDSLSSPVGYYKRLGGRKPKKVFSPFIRGYDLGLFLGLLLGDGYIYRNTIGFSQIKYLYLNDMFRDVVKKLFGNTTNTRGNKLKLTSFGDLGLAEYLSSFGKYARNKRLPPDIFRTMDPEEARGFLYGFFLADGSYDEKKGSVRFLTTSLGLSGNIYTLLTRAGFNPSFHKSLQDSGFKKKSGRKTVCYVVSICGESGRNLMDWLEGTPFSRPVRGSPIHHDGAFMRSQVSSVVKEHFSGPVYNLTVEDDNTYVVSGMSVHNCSRPNYSNSIYGPEVIDKALTDPVPMSEDGELHVGIDWGIQSKNSLAITLVEKRLEHLFVHEAVFWDHKLVSDVVLLLNEWTEKYRKPLKIYCDRSHPFNNGDLRKAGFEVNPVDFGTYKNIGIANVSKYLIFRRMRINRNLGVLIEQLKKYRSDDAGKALKIDDHGPDSLMCSCLDWKFENLFGEDAHRVTLEDLRSQEEKAAMLSAKRVNIAAMIPKDITSRIAIPKNFGINGLMP